jgi:integrase
MKYAKSLHKDPIKLIDRVKILNLRDEIAINAGQVQANRTLASLSACWSWGLRNGVIAEGDNPASYIDKFPEKPRDRVLTMAQLRAIWKATAGGGKHDRLVRFLMLTIVRRSEAGGMAWVELNEDLWVIPSHRMKSGVSHEVVLPPIAFELLPLRDTDKKDTFVFGVDTPFSGWSGAKKRLNKAVGFDDWGLHDFRRTFSTEMNSRGLAAPHIIEATLAHIGAKGGIAGVYNTASYRSQKQAALLAWTNLLTGEGVIDAAS